MTLQILLAVSLAIAPLAMLHTGAQTPASQSQSGEPAFDTAEVVPIRSADGVYFNYMRGRFSARGVTLRVLIRSAYGVQDAQIVGGPEWVGIDRFNIIATGDIGQSPGPMVAHDGSSRLDLMMQALLADRFKLVVHKERRESDVYALAVDAPDGSLGPGLRRSDIDCLALALEARRPASGSPAPARPPQPSSRCELSRDGGSLRIGGRAMGQLVSSLSNITGAPIVDETGLTGNFDVTLTWAQEERASAPARKPPAAGQRTTAAAGGPPLFAAIRKQLGLSLVPRHTSTEVLVIDRAERLAER